MATVATPLEMLTGDLDAQGLAVPQMDPFVGTDPLDEPFFNGLAFDIVALRLELLLLLDWQTSDEGTIGKVGLLAFTRVAEFGWKAEGWDLPQPPHWWTVMPNGLVGLGEAGRMEISPLPGWRPRFSGGREPRYRYRIGTNPSSEAVMAFESASYFEGRQLVPDDQHPRVRFDAQTEWYAACSWPR